MVVIVGPEHVAPALSRNRARRRLWAECWVSCCILASALGCGPGGRAAAERDTGSACFERADGVLSAGHWWGGDGHTTLVVDENGSARFDNCGVTGDVARASVAAGRFSWSIHWFRAPSDSASSVDFFDSATGYVCEHTFYVKFAYLGGTEIMFQDTPSEDMGGCE